MTDAFQHKKSLGQHFLNSEVVPRWLCDAGAVGAGNTILEIGPGAGALTSELLKRNASIVALEADARALLILKEKFAQELASGQLTLHHSDVRELDLASVGLDDHQFKVVANIPYYLSGWLFRSLLENSIQPNTLVFLIQKEVARRITSDLAHGEKESLLSLSVKAFGHPTYVKTVGRSHFTPPPAVDSAIVTVEKIGRDNFTHLDKALFFELLHLGFGQKRKQLVGNLAKKYPRQQVLDSLSTLNLPHDIRAEDIPLPTWLSLTTILSTPTKSTP